MSLDFPFAEDTLLSRMAEGDESAFTAIYQQYWESLFCTAAKVLRGKEEAADVVQDVFLSLWNRRHDLKITGSLGAYLATSVRYKAIHYIEKNITRKDYLALLTDTIVTHMPAAETQLHLKAVQAVIQATVENMPPKMKEVYHLSRNEHLSHQQIAERLGISAETVKKHIQHALQLIKTALSDPSLALMILLFHLPI